MDWCREDRCGGSPLLYRSRCPCRRNCSCWSLLVNIDKLGINVAMRHAGPIGARAEWNRVGGDFCGRPLSHHRTCFIASGGSPRNRQNSRVTASCLGHFLASAGEGSALWLNPSSFTAFAQPAVPPFGAFCLHRLSREPLKFLPSSTFGPSRHLRAGTMAFHERVRSPVPPFRQ